MAEHLVIGLKIIIALIIPDVPYKVQEDEMRREMIGNRVEKELREIKYSSNSESFTEITQRLEREAQEVLDREVNEENEAEEEGKTQVEITANR